MNIKTRALRHEVAHVKAPDGLDFEQDGVVYSDSDIQTYARPEIGNNILIGSEDPECDPKEWVDDPDSFNTQFSEQWKIMVMRLAQRLPELRIPEQARGVVSLYDVSDDWMPIYDKSDLRGFYMAVGTSGNQFKNAPLPARSWPLWSTLANKDTTMTAIRCSSNCGISENRSPLPRFRAIVKSIEAQVFLLSVSAI